MQNCLLSVAEKNIVTRPGLPSCRDTLCNNLPAASQSKSAVFYVIWLCVVHITVEGHYNTATTQHMEEEK